MRQAGRLLGVAVLLGLAAGCASMEDKAGLKQVGADVQGRIGQRVVWNQGMEDDRKVAQELAKVLEGELTADAAVQSALLNNRRLQAKFEDLGIAQADLVQAGLLSNPVFSIMARFPDGGGGTNLELGINQQFMELVSLPLRKKVAKSHFEQAQAQVADVVLDLAAQTRQAFVELQFAQQTVEMRQWIQRAAQASEEAALRLREAGNTRQLDLESERATAQQAELDLESAQREVAAAREKLVRLMGLPAWSKATKITTRMPEVPEERFDAPSLERQAMDERLDLMAARHAAEAAAQSLGIAKIQLWLEGSSIGVDTERDVSGSRVTGPRADVPIPLFDQGQAVRAKAKAQLRQMRQNYLALKTEVASEIRDSLTRLAVSASHARRYQHTLLPLRERITHLTQLQYNAMQVSVFQLMQAKQQEVMAGQAYLGSLRDYWLARSSLERSVGRDIALPAPITPVSRPATAPAVQQTTDHSMRMER